MLSSAGYGFLTILLAGIVQGTMLTPMPYLRRWRWENIWLVYSFFAYLLLPWVFAIFTVPKVLSVLAATPHLALQRTLLFGFLWGLAVVLYGLGIDMLGLALGTAIILGLGTSFGSLVPLFGQNRQQLWSSPAMLTLGGVFLLTVAVVLFSVAGRKRDEILKARSGCATIDTGLVRGGRFLGGLVVCILCGVLNPFINIAFAYGREIQQVAVSFGANRTSAGNSVWLLVANAGFLPSFVYTLYLLKRNCTWGKFQSGSISYWLLAPLMGFMWISCTVMYGVGANLMGSLGPAVGWPVFMSTGVLIANCWGFFTGEWKGIQGRPLHLQAVGLSILIAAIFTLGLASRP